MAFPKLGNSEPTDRRNVEPGGVVDIPCRFWMQRLGPGESTGLVTRLKGGATHKNV